MREELAKALRVLAKDGGTFSRREADRLYEVAVLIDTANHVGAAYAGGRRVDNERVEASGPRATEAGPERDVWGCSGCGATGGTVEYIQHERDCQPRGRWFSQRVKGTEPRTGQAVVARPSTPCVVCAKALECPNAGWAWHQKDALMMSRTSTPGESQYKGVETPSVSGSPDTRGDGAVGAPVDPLNPGVDGHDSPDQRDPTLSLRTDYTRNEDVLREEHRQICDAMPDGPGLLPDRVKRLADEVNELRAMNRVLRENNERLRSETARVPSDTEIARLVRVWFSNLEEVLCDCGECAACALEAAVRGQPEVE